VAIAGDSVAAPGTTPNFYTLESFAIPGSAITSASTALSFEGLNSPSQGIDFNLDDVALTTVAVPEPATAWLLGPLVLFGLRRPRPDRRPIDGGH
jgi:hypothetical protein